MVKAFYTPTDKRLPTELARINQSLRDIQRPTGTEKNRSLLGIEDALSALQDQQARLADAGQIYTTTAGGPWTGQVWASGARSVVASSMSRRFRVSVHATASGQTSLFSFSATGYPRDRILGGSTEAAMARVSAFGGASDTTSVYGSWIVTMPGTGNYTFTAEGRGTGDFSAMQALGITVEPLL